MTSFAAASLRQTATYWSPSASDPSGDGDTGFAAPVLIACRWQDSIQVARIGQGHEVVSMAQVYPDRELAPQAYVALGDHTATADPRSVARARQVVHAGVSVSVDETEKLYKAWL